MSPMTECDTCGRWSAGWVAFSLRAGPNGDERVCMKCLVPTWDRWRGQLANGDATMQVHESRQAAAATRVVVRAL